MNKYNSVCADQPFTWTRGLGMDLDSRCYGLWPALGIWCRYHNVGVLNLIASSNSAYSAPHTARSPS